MRAKITKTTLEKLTNVVPKWSQNLSKIDPGGALEASWEPPLKQGASKTYVWRFWLHVGTHLGPVWAHFGHHVFDVFLKGLFDGLGLHLASQNTSKMRPKRVPKTHLIKKWKSSSRCSQSSIQRGVGVLKIIIFSMFFWNPLLGWLLEPISVILAHFWGPFSRPCWSLFGYHFCIVF